MTFLLDFSNGLWSTGHFYQAVLVFMPVQIAYVFAHNFGLWATLIVGNSYYLKNEKELGL